MRVVGRGLWNKEEDTYDTCAGEHTHVGQLVYDVQSEGVSLIEY